MHARLTDSTTSMGACGHASIHAAVHIHQEILAPGEMPENPDGAVCNPWHPWHAHTHHFRHTHAQSCLLLLALT
jgi:hypothetical protein